MLPSQSDDPADAVQAQARRTAAYMVKSRARDYARRPMRLEILYPGLAAAEAKTLIAVATHLLSSERTKPAMVWLWRRNQRAECQSGTALGPHIEAAREAGENPELMLAADRLRRHPATVFAAQAHDHIDFRDLVTFRRLEMIARADAGHSNIHYPARVLVIEMAMVSRIGIEDRLATLNCKAANETDVSEQVQHIINRRERRKHPRFMRLSRERVGGHMPIALAEQQFGQTKPLPCGAQPVFFEQRPDLP